MRIDAVEPPVVQRPTYVSLVLKQVAEKEREKSLVSGNSSNRMKKVSMGKPHNDPFLNNFITDITVLKPLSLHY